MIAYKLMQGKNEIASWIGRIPYHFELPRDGEGRRRFVEGATPGWKDEDEEFSIVEVEVPDPPVVAPPAPADPQADMISALQDAGVLTAAQAKKASDFLKAKRSSGEKKV